MKRLILASGSLSRRRMLAGAGFHFEVVPAQLDEVLVTDVPAGEQALALALAKAHNVHKKHPDAIVVGADQVVLLPNGDIASKPEDRDGAKEQLLVMQGKTHVLISAAAVLHDDEEHVFADQAVVTFRPLSADAIEHILSWNEWPGTAGATQLESRGVHLVDTIDGDWFTIMGMPLLPIAEHLRALGVGPLL